MTIQEKRRRFLRPSLGDLASYEPSEPVESIAARIGRPVEDLIRLDLNENPYGTSPRVQKALAGFDSYHRYPDADQRLARKRLAAYCGAPADRIIISNGADEMIDLLMLATIDPGDEVIVPEPTFGVYRARPALFGGVSRLVQRTPNFDLNLDAIEDAINDRTRLIFITSPNNPTGNLPTYDQIARLVRTGVLVIVDEAYYEFCGKTYLPLVHEYDNLVVMRTLSKWAGLAGLRIGYTIFPDVLAAEIWKIKQPFNVSAAGLLAVEAALDDQDELLHRVSHIRAERDRLSSKLHALDFLHSYPSQGNFILCRVANGDAHGVHARLIEQGVITRKYREPALRDYLRISVGRPEDTDALIAALSVIEAGM